MANGTHASQRAMETLDAVIESAAEDEIPLLESILRNRLEALTAKQPKPDAALAIEQLGKFRDWMLTECLCDDGVLRDVLAELDRRVAVLRKRGR